MPRQIFLRLITSLFVALWSLSAAAQQQDLLQAEEAFRLTVERETNDTIEMRWQIEDGYYLYRDHLEAKNPATGEKVAITTEPGIV